ncbi:hypothetical protein [Limnobacter sp.]|uniref:hypothetical protein n=1 Tax=Limnobacter sp. TaxID=2003368 RepID=UPI003519415F
MARLPGTSWPKCSEHAGDLGVHGVVQVDSGKLLGTPMELRDENLAELASSSEKESRLGDVLKTCWELGIAKPQVFNVWTPK